MSRAPWQERFWERVHKTDTCWLWTGTKDSRGYGQLSVEGKKRLVHRLAYTTYVGDIPEGLYIDHICHTRLCIRPRHLRLATHAQNMENLSGLLVTNKSGYRGVHWHTAVSKWKAVVSKNGVKHVAGYFHDVHEAGAAALAMRNKLFTHNDLDRT